MKQLISMAALMILVSSSSAAHEFHPLKLSRIERLGDTGNYYLYLDGTVKGRPIVCALYASDRTLIMSTTAFTDNLATKVIFLNAPKPPKFYKCVYN